ncbi:Ovarian tumor associated protein [Intoshia linei]|uniref:Ovarian tumor associated protein n=1 Tax=Intoshia linei TaxID=1819745 RepID=A0A177ART0_9BILA|nr:Ovarian tumor associated protein [Intoshia linei]
MDHYDNFFLDQRLRCNPLCLYKINLKNKKIKSKKSKKAEITVTRMIENSSENTVKMSEKEKNDLNDISHTTNEINFKLVKRARRDRDITKKAAISYRQRINKLNTHLDNLTEHNDIPKVSWTK